jgi:hypothetical protein
MQKFFFLMKTYGSSLLLRRENNQALWSRAVGSKVTRIGDRWLNQNVVYFQIEKQNRQLTLILVEMIVLFHH